MSRMWRALACAAVAACALLAPGAAAARPFTDVASLTPFNKQGQKLQQVRRGRDVTLVVGFRMSNAPLSKGYRVRVSATLRRGDAKLVIMSSRHPVVYTGVYRFSLPLRVPRSFDAGAYRLLGIVAVLDGKKVVARDTRVRGLKVV